MADEYRDLTSGEKLAERAIGLLTAQKGITGGGKVDLLEHGLQTATRWVPAALDDYDKKSK